MKTRKYEVSLLSLLIAVFFSSCGWTNIVEDTEPRPYVLIIKFKDPAYRNNLIVSNYDDIEKLVLMRGNMCERTHFLTWPSLCPELNSSPDEIIAWYD